MNEPMISVSPSQFRQFAELINELGEAMMAVNNPESKASWDEMKCNFRQLATAADHLADLIEEAASCSPDLNRRPT